MINYLPSILLFIAGALNGIMDLIQFHYDNSKFKGLNENYFNPKKSWVNKWKWVNEYKGGYPIVVRKERFWGSSRWFVRFTDFWHLVKSFMILCIIASVIIGTKLTLIQLVLTILAWWLGFWLTYESKLLRK